MVIFYSIGSLVLGLLAWALAAAACHNKVRLLIGSYAACAVSILLQLCNSSYYVQIEDWSALMDTVHASVLCGEILLGVTAVLSVIAIVRSIRKQP